MVELTDIETGGHCKLDTQTGRVVFVKEAKENMGFFGLFYRNENTFFALIRTIGGPVMFYKGKEYEVSPELHIQLVRDGKKRKFSIEEYGIEIEYPTSKYLDFDPWSTEPDVDLFAQIELGYKTEAFYKKYTLN